jgi:hypothetical protein
MPPAWSGAWGGREEGGATGTSPNRVVSDSRSPGDHVEIFAAEAGVARMLRDRRVEERRHPKARS